VGLFVCVTGVSARQNRRSSTTRSITPSRASSTARPTSPPRTIRQGLEFFDKAVSVDQSPIGRTPRSNPPLTTALFHAHPRAFRGVPMARERGYGPGRFSFNVKGGRCEACQGDGVIKVEMHFLPDIYVPCDTCHGKRYNRETLEVQFKGRTSTTSADDGGIRVRVLQRVPAVERKLQTLLEVASAIYSSDSRRPPFPAARRSELKLSLELSKRDTGARSTSWTSRPRACTSRTSICCSRCCTACATRGNTVVVIEHNLDVIKTADWIIDLGPEGGEAAGASSPRDAEDVAALDARLHRRYLRTVLEKRERRAA